MIVQDVSKLKQKSYDCMGYDKVLANNLLLTLGVSPGVGLAAIQIGVPLRMCIIRTTREMFILWNAKIISRSVETYSTQEGCLSLPGIRVPIARTRDITVENGDGKRYAFSEDEAVIVQHEMDHWEGRLITDYGSDDGAI